ncbi:hypothetical protein HELRODRAFT_166961 [Helobdella robusta]|uniref:Uncharacterized protein n=1 Tax=Helobdella robusta TaxID=6412 RepID=T1EYT3_HELRO|nr:hypothetical protein HELRODRAFT_166961 [Helobdella robusta]ESO11877.1 hypothetical protein HELRODRAFT_166961 [Helobdella robusta]
MVDKSLLHCRKNANNTMVVQKKYAHTGSDVARVNKVHAAVLGTRGCNVKYATESQKDRLKMGLTRWRNGRWEDIMVWNIEGARLWSWNGYWRKSKKALLEYNPVNERMMYARFKGYPRDIDVVVIYAPTMDHSYAEIEAFYDQLKQTLNVLPKKDVKIITGDWNAKIGRDNIGFEEVMGKYGIGNRNNRGERLLEFAKDQKMYITNTKTQNTKKWTWESPDGKTTNMIDLILIGQKWLKFVTQCRAFPNWTLGAIIYELKLFTKCHYGISYLTNDENKLAASINVVVLILFFTFQAQSFD